MLFVLFQLGNDRYAIDSGDVAEVLPLVEIKKIPQSPPGVAGAIDYRGMPLPVIDLSELALRRPSLNRLSTRILVVYYPDRNNTKHLLGLIAENATATIRRDSADFVPSGITNGGTPYLGPVAADPGGMIQWIQTTGLLPATVRDLLFQQSVEP